MYATHLKLLRDDPPLAVITSRDRDGASLHLADLASTRALPPEALGAQRIDDDRLLLWASDKLGWADLETLEARWSPALGPLMGALRVGDWALAWGPGGLTALSPAGQTLTHAPTWAPAIRDVRSLHVDHVVVRCADRPGARVLAWRSGAVLATLEEPVLDAQVVEDGVVLALSAIRPAVLRWDARAGEVRAHVLPTNGLGAMKMWASPRGLAVISDWERRVWWVHPEEGVRAGPVEAGDVLGLSDDGALAAVSAWGQLQLLREGVLEVALPWMGPMPRVRFYEGRLLALLPMRAEDWDLQAPGALRALQFHPQGAGADVTRAGQVFFTARQGGLHAAPPRASWPAPTRSFVAPRPASRSWPAGEDHGLGDAEVQISVFGAPGLGAGHVTDALTQLGVTVEPVSPYEVDALPCSLRQRGAWLRLRGAEALAPALMQALAQRLERPVERLQVTARGEMAHAPPDEGIAPCWWGALRAEHVHADGRVSPVDPPWAGAWTETIDLDRVRTPYEREALEAQLLSAAWTRAWSVIEGTRHTEGGHGAWSLTLPAPAEAPPPAAPTGPPRLTLLLPEPVEISAALEHTLRGALLDGGVLDEESAAPDLSAHTERLLRRAGLDAPPPLGSPEREAFDARWLRLSQRQRAAVVSEGRRIPAWKLDAAGQWALTPAEIKTLRRWLERVEGAEARALDAALGSASEGCEILAGPER